MAWGWLPNMLPSEDDQRGLSSQRWGSIIAYCPDTYKTFISL